MFSLYKRQERNKMLRGLDCSKWQGDINWSSVAKNQDFAIIRSSYGTGYTDEKFARNRDGARKEGILHGYYHYSYPNHNSPEAEADWFLSVVSPLRAGESLYLDFEENYPNPVEWSERFLDRISESLEGYKALIYLNKHTVNSYDWSRIANKSHGLWLAYWDYDPNGSFEVPYWNVVAMRQYSNQGQVNGINGRVDLNVFYGEEDQFLAYGVQLGEIPCEKLKLENTALKVENRRLLEENKDLVEQLNDLSILYKNLLEDSQDATKALKKMTKKYADLTKLYKEQSDHVFELDKKLQACELKIEVLEAEISRLKQQKFTCKESIGFLLKCLRGGEKA